MQMVRVKLKEQRQRGKMTCDLWGEMTEEREKTREGVTNETECLRKRQLVSVLCNTVLPLKIRAGQINRIQKSELNPIR